MRPVSSGGEPHTRMQRSDFDAFQGARGVGPWAAPENIDVMVDKHVTVAICFIEWRKKENMFRFCAGSKT